MTHEQEELEQAQAFFDGLKKTCEDIRKSFHKPMLLPGSLYIHAQEWPSLNAMQNIDDYGCPTPKTYMLLGSYLNISAFGSDNYIAGIVQERLDKRLIPIILALEEAEPQAFAVTKVKSERGNLIGADLVPLTCIGKSWQIKKDQESEMSIEDWDATLLLDSYSFGLPPIIADINTFIRAALYGKLNRYSLMNPRNKYTKVLSKLVLRRIPSS